MNYEYRAIAVEGYVVCLLGRNGAGKTATKRTIIGGARWTARSRMEATTEARGRLLERLLHVDRRGIGSRQPLGRSY